MTQTLTLPAITIPDHTTATPLGTITVPGFTIPARMHVIDPAVIHQMIHQARLATETAYHNYSTKPFRVGASLIMADDGAEDGRGEIFSAANSEMGVLNAGICAERALINYVVSKGFRRIKYLCVSTPNRRNDITQRGPCGLCRQTIAEFADADTLIIIDHQQEGALADIVDIARLLPYAYHLQQTDSV